MSARFDLRLSKPEFLRWIEAPERRAAKFEWSGGRVVRRARATRAHALIASNVMMALGSLLDRSAWSIMAANFYVESEAFLRIPDVIVEAAGGDLKARSTSEPVLLFEILSPSSVKTDLVDKPAEYARFPSLGTYVVLSQDEVVAWVWERQADGAFPAMPAEVRGRDAGLDLSRRGISLPLAEVYRGLAIE